MSREKNTYGDSASVGSRPPLAEGKQDLMFASISQEEYGDGLIKITLDGIGDNSGSVEYNIWLGGNDARKVKQAEDNMQTLLYYAGVRDNVMSQLPNEQSWCGPETVKWISLMMKFQVFILEMAEPFLIYMKVS